MGRLRSIGVAVFCGLTLFVSLVVDARAERRVALVIGNAHYSNASLALSNPKNDAEDVASALRSLGFEVIQSIDADRRTFDLNLANFARMATNSDAALFYYAGHALQYQGRNYLMPVDSEVQDEVSLRYQLVAIDDVRDAVGRTNGVKVIILDACRNNPVLDTLRRRSFVDSRDISSSRGLARMDKTQGMVVAYSTAADEVAADGSGRNSPFTAALLKWLKEPGLEIEKLFRRITSDVNAATDGRQRPETYVSLLSDFYLNQSDRVAYENLKDTVDPGLLKNFIQKFPASSYAVSAKSRLDAIEAAVEERMLQQTRLETQREQQKTEALRRELEEQRAKLATAERERAEREAARQRQEEERAKQAAAERERAARESAQRQQDEQRIKVADLERQKPQGSAPSPASSSGSGGTTTAALQPSPALLEVSCQKDQDRLVRLRSNPSRDEIVQFERELTCEQLRPQLVRLRESLSPGETVAFSAEKPGVSPARLQPTQIAGLPSAIQPIANDQKSDRPKNAQRASTDQINACKRDELRLTKLRAKPGISEIAEFERGLECEKLRPQIVRLRESLSPPNAGSKQNLEDAERAPEQAQQGTPSRDPAQSCDQETRGLALLREHPTRESVTQFEQQLACEDLRPQVLRLLESLSGG